MNISESLKKLVQMSKISELELSRRTGVAQPIINRLISGENTNPKIATLKPLADFFCVSISKLIGEEGIQNAVSLASSPSTNLNKIPTFSIKHFAKNHNIKQLLSKITRFTLTEREVNENSFACEIDDDAMLPLFPKGMVLIFDVNASAKHKDFVLMRIEKTNQILFRQLYIHNEQRLLLSLNPAKEQELITISNKDVIIGVLVQTKKDY
ncbi:MAG: LexA family transcriptional regulator [Pseudomonadota bacterium]